MGTWYAKVLSGYAPLSTSTETVANMNNIYDVLKANEITADITVEAVAGICGNAYAESALNPWRWQSDLVGHTSLGYGLWGFTPSTKYIGAQSSREYYAPNTTSPQSATAKPTDGIAQTNYMIDAASHLGSWVRGNWRNYWSKTSYASLYATSKRIVKEWGSDGYISFSEFQKITNVSDAAFVFMACYEGPAKPNFSDREDYANTCYKVISGHEPTPPTPTPTPVWSKGGKLWMYLYQPWKHF